MICTTSVQHRPRLAAMLALLLLDAMLGPGTVRINARMRTRTHAHTHANTHTSSASVEYPDPPRGGVSTECMMASPDTRHALWRCVNRVYGGIPRYSARVVGEGVQRMLEMDKERKQKKACEAGGHDAMLPPCPGYHCFYYGPGHYLLRDLAHSCSS